MEDELYRVMGNLGGMNIPLSQPKGGFNDKQLGSRGGENAAEFSPSKVVDKPLNKNAS